MKAPITLFLSIFCLHFALAQGGEVLLTEVRDTSKKDQVWTFGGGLGLDLAGLGIINPRVGAGDNRLGLGGLLNVFANKKRDKYFWDNNASLQLSTQRVGGSEEPFQKNIDVLRLGSRYGYNIFKNVLFLAVDATAETQLLPTYVGNAISGPDSNLLSEFLSPLRVAIAPGLDYKPTPQLSFFFAPASLNLIYVGNDMLINLPGQPLGNEAGKHTRTQIGYTLKAQYANKFYKDKIALASKIGWFADYTQNLNGNVLWQNNMSIQLFKGFALDLFGDIFYDHFTLVVVEDIPEGTAAADVAPYLGLKPSYIGGFLLKYNRIF